MKTYLHKSDEKNEPEGGAREQEGYQSRHSSRVALAEDLS